jgi:uncharacterized caspase-like protein/peptidoglycan hydrolase-like protein with peptidoglycan-binding domain
MSRNLFYLLLALVSSLAVASDTAAERLALVVGNSAYTSTSELPNAQNDARVFGKFLESNNFQVTEILNANRSEMARGIARFSHMIDPDDIAIFFYAGHGMQLRGENFLLGVDARLESEFDVPAETVALDAIISGLERKSATALLFVDACRDNPLAARLNTIVDGATRGGQTRGLAPIQSTGSGTMIAFSASPGQVAYDGPERNSFFTLALIKHLATPQIEIGTAFKRVIRDVRQETQGKQSPQIVSNLATEIYLAPDTSVDGDADGSADQSNELGTSKTPDAASEIPTSNSGVAPALNGDEGLASPNRIAMRNPLNLQQKVDVEAGQSQRLPESNDVELDFAAAERISTARSWQLFLSRHPHSEFAKVAIARLHSIQGGQPRSVSAEESEFNLTTQNVITVQSSLIAAGYDPGSADGSLGPNTRREIARYQKAVGLPPTGFLNRITLEGLGVVGVRPKTFSSSGSRARVYLAGDLERLEDDGRIVDAARCLKGKPFVYGVYEDRLYLAVLDYSVTWSGAIAWADRCEASLVSITSASENEFVYRLFADDERFFATGFDSRFSISYKSGPWIGLVQEPGAPEPGGGWHWSNGEPLKFRNWLPHKPSEVKNEQDFGKFQGERHGEVRDFQSLNASKWFSSTRDSSSHGYVLEFE